MTLSVLSVVPRYPPPVVGGLERQAHELNRALVRRGVRVTALSGRFEAAQPSIARVDGVEVRRIAYPEAGPGLVRTAAQAVRTIVGGRAGWDVVHLHNLSWFGAVVVAAARAAGIPVLAKLPSTGRGGPLAQLSRPGGRLWGRVFRGVDAVVALSEESVAEAGRLGLAPDRVLSLHNGVAVDAFAAPRPPRPAGAPLRAVFIGRLISDKGVADLLEAWQRAGHPAGAVLELYGAGPAEGELRAAARAREVDGSVRFMGETADVPGVLGTADLFVLPSYREGNSNAVLEAMAAGVPVLSTRVGGTPMLVGPAGAPWLVEPGDAGALADRLARLLADASARMRLGADLRARARRFFDIDVVAGHYLRAYELLLTQRGGDLRAASSPLFADPGAARYAVEDT